MVQNSTYPFQYKNMSIPEKYNFIKLCSLRDSNNCSEIVYYDILYKYMLYRKNIIFQPEYIMNIYDR